MGNAPSILDYLNDQSKAYFEKVKEYLKNMGIDFIVDPNLVRGLDYYNHTAFEIMSDAKGFGAITTLAGGGRYNGLIDELDGPSTPGIGFGMGMERLLMALEAEDINIPTESDLDCFLIAVGDAAEMEAVRLVHQLRQVDIKVDKDYQNRKIKGQFKAADRLNAKFVLILGEDELEKQVVNVKSMESGEQIEIPISTLVETMQGKLQGGNK